MRILAFVCVLALVWAGPAAYFTVGQQAREERLGKLQDLRAGTDQVRTLLDLHAPLGLETLTGIEAEIRLREQQADSFVQRLTGSRAAPEDLADAGLARLAGEAGIDDSLLDPLLYTISGGTAETARRRALHAFLSALAALRDHATILVRELRVMPERRPEGRTDPASSVGGVTLAATLLGPASSVVRLVEQTLAGSDRSGPGDLLRLEVRRTTEGEWLDLPGAWMTEEPPVEVRVVIRLFDGGKR